MVGKDEEGEGSSSSSRAPTPTIQNTSPSTTAAAAAAAAAAAVVGKSDGITSNKKTDNVDVNMDPNNNSNDGDWKGSGRTQREILDVATFAADNLIEYAKKDNNYKTTTGNDGIKISFDLFGKWYNSGGFTHVPWLELLDLSKWDYTDDGGGDGVNNYSSLHQSSSSKRARMSPAHNIDHPLNTSTMGGISNMHEPIGSPTNFFTSGAMIVATPHPPTSTTDGGGGVQSFSAMFGERNESSRTVVSFDFSGSDTTTATTTMGGGGAGTSSFHIDITEENLVMLGNLVRRTGFSSLTPQHVESLMMKHARAERHKYGETIYVISRAEFGKFIRDVVPKESSKNFDPVEIENFSNYFTNFFTCFDYSWSELKKDEVNAKELLVGFTFLFAGNKSSKLAASYEILDVDRVGYLTQRGLMQYLRSYLTMLAGISLLSASKKTTTQIRKRLMSSKRDDAFLAVENGAKWTLSHFLRQFEQELERGQRRNSTRTNAVTFEDFAKWYTEGGYAVAPWLELLDLHKFLSLIGESSKDPPGSNDESLSEVLFTFPLAKGRSLIVLRDDAHYVRSVVSELGLLSLTSEDIWSVLFNDVANSIAAEGGPGKRKNLRMEVDQMTFVNCMMRILSGTGKIRQNSSQWPDFSPEGTLKNFYLSFDLSESKRVPLHQLMCGLTLLCGGKKSNKLVFAFGLFCSDDIGKNGKKKSSMIHNDFFYFFRSFLIVMFSCCNQSLSLSAEVVTQYISDTAKQVADDVMAYWKIRNVEKVKFENFSEWYNEGGFETAPWLELLDLTKWVLADQVPIQHQQQQHHQQYDHAVPPTPAVGIHPSDIDGFGLTPGAESIRALWATPRAKINGSAPNTGNLPLGPDDDFDLGILDAEEDAMDLFLQQESGAAHHGGHVDNVNYMYPIAGQTPSAKSMEAQNALKFNLLTNDQFGGYIISIGQNQVQLLHRIVTKTGLYLIDAPTICKFILYDAKSRRQVNLSRKSFQSAMKRVFDYAFKSSPSPISSSIEDELSDFTTKLFISLDNQKTGKINAVSVACGFSVLCGGRKSDKLEYVFELLDEDKDTLVSKQDINRFISSFLVMLLSVSSSFTHLYGDGVCSNDAVAITRAIEAGSDWATTQVFDALQSPSGNISFDDFADWYTKGGYQSIPWLELLDLRKWVLGET
jgi:Ca2+-binding EF-hand superfamily protein